MSRYSWLLSDDTPLRLFVGAFVALIAYANSLPNEFTFDDSFAIVNNADVFANSTLSNIWQHDFWGQPLESNSSHKSFRPLTSLLFALLNRLSVSLFGLQHPFLFHVANVILHAINTMLVYIVAVAILSMKACPCESPACAWVSPQVRHTAMLAEILFAVHPIHTESVATSVGLADSLSGLFFLSSFLCAALAWPAPRAVAIATAAQSAGADHAAPRRPRKCGFCAFLRTWSLLGVSVALLCVALLCKEVSATLPALVLTYDFIRSRADARRARAGLVLGLATDLLMVIARVGLWVTVLAAFVYFRKWKLGAAMEVGQQVFRPTENPLPFLPTRLARVLSTAHVHALYFGQLLYPVNLSCDFSYHCVSLVHSWTDPLNIPSLLTYAALPVLLLVCVVRYLRSSAGSTKSCGCSINAHWPPADSAPAGVGVPGDSETTAPETDVDSVGDAASGGAPNDVGSAASTTSTGMRRRAVTAKTAVVAPASSTSVPPQLAVAAPGGGQTLGCAVCVQARLVLLLVWIVATFLPASNIFFYVGTTVAERLLYLPSVGFCIAVAYLFGRTVSQLSWKVTKAMLLIAAGCLLVAAGLRTFRRNADWRTDESLFASALDVCPNSVKVLQNYAILLRRKQKFQAAQEVLFRAKRIQAEYCDVDYWIGMNFINMAQVPKALHYLNKSLSCVFSRNDGATTLGKVYNELLTVQPGNASVVLQWAHSLAHLEQYDSALYHYVQAGSTLAQQGQLGLAAECWDAAQRLPVSLGNHTCTVWYWSALVQLELHQRLAPDKQLPLPSAVQTSITSLKKVISTAACQQFKMHALDQIAGLAKPLLNKGQGEQYPQLYALTAMVLRHLGQHKEASSHYRAAGMAYFNKGLFQKASTLFQRAARFDRHNDELHYLTGLSLIKEGKVRDGVQRMNSVAKKRSKAGELARGVLQQLGVSP